MVSKDPHTGGAVSVNNLCKSFGASVEALRDINLEIEEGAFTAFIGPSGCGKTTLLRILAGLEHASSGEVEILGNTPEAACRQSQIGVAFQRPALVESRTARENVRLTLEITKAQPNRSVEELLEKFGIGQFMDSYPHELSGGMQQRVNIACALVHDPKILLLDEPFGALDELTREKLGEWLNHLLKEEKRTGVLITHSVDEAVYLSDRVIVLSAGPGQIHQVIDIPIQQPRPRSIRSNHDFLQLVAKVRHELYTATELENTQP